MATQAQVSVPALVRAELLALRTIRAPGFLVAAAFLLTVVLATKPVIEAGKAGAASIGTSAAMLAVLDAAGGGSLVVLLLGVLTVTAEFRHETATGTFLHTPRRSRVIAAKAVTTALVGAALAVADLAAVLAVGLSTGAVRPSLLNADILLRVLGLGLVYPLYGLLGVGVGALLIYQPVSVVLPLAWLLFVEDLVLHLLPHGLAPWSLRGVTAALANAGDLTAVLPVPAGGGALLGYALLMLSLGTARVARRDIT
jgi:ABC-2 type transport system permease protein